MASWFVSPCGRASTCAIRYGRTANFAWPTTSSTGADTALLTCAATGSRATVATLGGSIVTGSDTLSGRSSDASAWTTIRSEAARSSFIPVRAGTNTGVRRRSVSDASRCGRFTLRSIRSSSYWRAGSYACAAGAMSAPKRRTPSLRKPRTGAGPSPWCSALDTARRQLTRTSSSLAVSFHRRPATRKTTGREATACACASSLLLASVGVSPPTATPATSTPDGTRAGEPANASPSSPTTSAMSPTATAVRCQSSFRARLRARADIPLRAKLASVSAPQALEPRFFVNTSALALTDLRDHASPLVQLLRHDLELELAGVDALDPHVEPLRAALLRHPQLVGRRQAPRAGSQGDS